MPYEHGMAALRLEMPPRVPRTEYSATEHWSLVKAVTGTDVDAFSDVNVKWRASRRFMELWDFDFNWNTLISGDEFGGTRTSMGHAVYADSGVDFNTYIKELFEDPEDVFRFDFYETFGKQEHRTLVKRFDESYASAAAGSPDMVNMTGIYITCMSGLIDLLGWDMLLTAAGTDLKRFGELTERYSEWIGQYFAALADCKAPVVMIHDDIVWTSGAFINPEWYRRYVFPNYMKMFDRIRQNKKIIVYTSDGDYTEFIDDIAGCGVNCFVMEPMTDMAYFAEKYGKTHSFIGNADTRILLSGSRDDIYNEVKRCMDIGKKCPGYFMAVGNHIPANTPVDNALFYNDAYEKLSKR